MTAHKRVRIHLALALELQILYGNIIQSGTNDNSFALYYIDDFAVLRFFIR